MKTKLFSCLCLLTILLSPIVNAQYDRNKAVPVEKVLFGKVQSVRNITEVELIEDKEKGWKVFGGALIGGAIGNQFGSGSGRDVATVLGALLGGSMANNKNPQYQRKTLHLVELMIKTDQGKEFMVVQYLDSRMIFQRNDAIRLIYLENGSVRLDKQM
ncbi:hypothetical protein A3Q34_18500 [Colwellia sp. PAMC 20917]|uniref:glycine zipper 2TM domain-containing protein n=1 Tax=Colwellia sp. PAMC 20917 TaxID=1816218 RepID=UPI000877F067|nr:glycine zipper 2TM domain-containing protein [Colwellia sp. PAMC 20917]AOW78652.1 hypothetical protein A3Q34_18500 [Colwellia sp. PAMC 20917]